MKHVKIIALLLSLLFLLCSTPMRAFATTANEDIDIYKIAEKAFPEYADRIRNPVTPALCGLNIDNQAYDVVIR